MPPTPQKKKCKNCKGEGWVYPKTQTEEPCYRCLYNNFDPAKQKACDYCSGKGYVMRHETLLCCHCDGGFVYE